MPAAGRSSGSRPLERAIMRVALFEILHREEIPVAVSIDEAVSITKRYCGTMPRDSSMACSPRSPVTTTRRRCEQRRRDRAAARRGRATRRDRRGSGRAETPTTRRRSSSLGRPLRSLPRRGRPPPRRPGRQPSAAPSPSVAAYPEDLRTLAEEYLAGLGASRPATRPTASTRRCATRCWRAGSGWARCLLATARALGLDPQGLLPTAASLELIHTYSLIHDDLPAMDDDDLRRGRPTSHVAFGEDVAILAGDALFAEAVRLVAESPAGGARPDPRRNPRDRGGHRGRRDGRRPVRGREEPRRRRPGVAAAAPFAQDRSPDLGERLLGAGARRGGGGRRRSRYRRFAAELGILFQIVDDILDVTGTDAELGKPHGSDERHGKLTPTSASSASNGARELARQSHAEALGALAGGPAATSSPLPRIADFIYTRQS